jgi:hypothetical protein
MGLLVEIVQPNPLFAQKDSFELKNFGRGPFSTFKICRCFGAVNVIDLSRGSFRFAEAGFPSSIPSRMMTGSNPGSDVILQLPALGGAGLVQA